MKEYFTRRLLMNKLNGNEDVINIIINYLKKNEENSISYNYLGNKIVDFGKHKGKTFRNVIIHHPYYIKWLLDQTNIINNEYMRRYLRYKSNDKISIIRLNKQRRYDFDNYNTY